MSDDETVAAWRRLQGLEDPPEPAFAAANDNDGAPPAVPQAVREAE